MNQSNNQSKVMTPYQAGYDCGKNGANTENCNFKWFDTPENTKEWERGKEESIGRE